MTQQEFIAQKIAQLRREGYPDKQAIAIAFSEWRALMKKNATKRRKVNPAENQASNVEKAARLYSKFTGHEAEIVGKVDKPKSPDVLVAIGDVDFIGYSTVRDGKLEKYIHRFKRTSRPLFCVTPDGSQIVLLGGAYDFTERGIVDKD